MKISSKKVTLIERKSLKDDISQNLTDVDEEVRPIIQANLIEFINYYLLSIS